LGEKRFTRVAEFLLEPLDLTKLIAAAAAACEMKRRFSQAEKSWGDSTLLAAFYLTIEISMNGQKARLRFREFKARSRTAIERIFGDERGSERGFENSSTREQR